MPQIEAKRVTSNRWWAADAVQCRNIGAMSGGAVGTGAFFTGGALQERATTGAAWACLVHGAAQRSPGQMPIRLGATRQVGIAQRSDQLGSASLAEVRSCGKHQRELLGGSSTRTIDAEFKRLARTRFRRFHCQAVQRPADRRIHVHAVGQRAFAPCGGAGRQSLPHGDYSTAQMRRKNQVGRLRIRHSGNSGAALARTRL